MAIELICKGCSRKLRVSDEHAGKHARCPECGEINPIVGGAPDAFASPGNRDDRGPGSLHSTHAYGEPTPLKSAPAAPVAPFPAAEPAAANPFHSFPQSPASNPFADQPAVQAPGIVAIRTHATYAAPHRGVLILVFAILGWAFCFIFSILAWAWGAEDLRKMRLGQMDPSGMGLTQAGMIIGIIHCGITALVIAMFVLMMVVGAAHG